MQEPAKKDLLAYDATPSSTPAPPRWAFCILQTPPTPGAIEVVIQLPGGGVVPADSPAPSMLSWVVKDHVQPLASPDDCFEAEALVKADPKIQALLAEKYNITDLSKVVCDPWSVHNPPFGGRLIQTFMYTHGSSAEDNAYARPIDFVPIVDLNLKKVVHIDKPHGDNPPKVPDNDINYHKDLCEFPVRADLKPLNVVQPDGPSWTLDGNRIMWQKWDIRISFNYREGLVLHNVGYRDGGRLRPVLHRLSLVEMAVPYSTPQEPFTRKCAFDVGDYGLGNCSSSLALGCDCLGHIHYFDALLNNSKGEPVPLPKAVCMHEEDHSILWKHVEYRTGHSEVRRSRRLVLSFIATVVNYEYVLRAGCPKITCSFAPGACSHSAVCRHLFHPCLFIFPFRYAFYYYFYQDGTISYEIKLTGELSTNTLDPSELSDGSSIYGTMVAPGVNAQYHQHMFSARLDMAVDDSEGGKGLVVSEVEVEALEEGPNNPAGNAFVVKETPLLRESEAQRVADPMKGRHWKISNPASLHPVTGKPVAWKVLLPASPLLLATKNSSLTKRGAFATKSLWVTPHSDEERWPAGDYTMQSEGGEGLPQWTAQDREIVDPVVWLTFGTTHVPRVEDFPVMPCDVVGFTLKPFCFFGGNPGVDVPSGTNAASTLAGSSCCAAANGHANGSANGHV